MHNDTRTWDFTITPHEGEVVELQGLAHDEALRLLTKLVHGWPMTDDVNTKAAVEAEKELVLT